jgi:hypothetical protein
LTDKQPSPACLTLLDDRIVTPFQEFHARVVNNAQDRRIAKATQQQPQQQQQQT